MEECFHQNIEDNTNLDINISDVECKNLNIINNIERLYVGQNNYNLIITIGHALSTLYIELSVGYHARYNLKLIFLEKSKGYISRLI